MLKIGAPVNCQSNISTEVEESMLHMTELRMHMPGHSSGNEISLENSVQHWMKRKVGEKHVHVDVKMSCGCVETRQPSGFMLTRRCFSKTNSNDSGRGSLELCETTTDTTLDEVTSDQHTNQVFESGYASISQSRQGQTPDLHPGDKHVSRVENRDDNTYSLEDFGLDKRVLCQNNKQSQSRPAETSSFLNTQTTNDNRKADKSAEIISKIFANIVKSQLVHKTRSLNRQVEGEAHASAMSSQNNSNHKFGAQRELPGGHDFLPKSQEGLTSDLAGREAQICMKGLGADRLVDTSSENSVELCWQKCASPKNRSDLTLTRSASDGGRSGRSKHPRRCNRMSTKSTEELAHSSFSVGMISSVVSYGSGIESFSLSDNCLLEVNQIRRSFRSRVTHCDYSQPHLDCRGGIRSQGDLDSSFLSLEQSPSCSGQLHNLYSHRRFGGKFKDPNTHKLCSHKRFNRDSLVCLSTEEIPIFFQQNVRELECVMCSSTDFIGEYSGDSKDMQQVLHASCSDNKICPNFSCRQLLPGEGNALFDDVVNLPGVGNALSADVVNLPGVGTDATHVSDHFHENSGNGNSVGDVDGTTEIGNVAEENCAVDHGLNHCSKDKGSIPVVSLKTVANAIRRISVPSKGIHMPAIFSSPKHKYDLEQASVAFSLDSSPPPSSMYSKANRRKRTQGFASSKGSWFSKTVGSIGQSGLKDSSSCSMLESSSTKSKMLSKQRRSCSVSSIGPSGSLSSGMSDSGECCDQTNTDSDGSLCAHHRDSLLLDALFDAKKAERNKLQYPYEVTDGRIQKKAQQFGLSLQDIKQNTGRIIPLPVEETIEFLKVVGGDEVEGLFRRCARVSTMKEVQEKYDDGENVDFHQYKDPHLAAAILKKFLRELQEPLMTYDLFEPITRLHFLETNKQLSEVQRILQDELPEDNYIILKFVFQFLQQVVNKSDINHMTAENIATVFGPNIAWPKGQNTLATVKQAVKFALILVKNFDDVFLR